GGTIVAGVVFLVVSGAAIGVLGGAMGRDRSPNDTQLLTAGTVALGRWGLWIVLAAAWIGTLTEAHGDMLAATRVAHAMGQEHELPGWLAALHARWKSPHHAAIALGAVSAALALVVDLRRVLELANVFTIVWYAVVHFDA